MLKDSLRGEGPLETKMTTETFEEYMIKLRDLERQFVMRARNSSQSAVSLTCWLFAGLPLLMLLILAISFAKVVKIVVVAAAVAVVDVLLLLLVTLFTLHMSVRTVGKVVMTTFSRGD